MTRRRLFVCDPACIQEIGHNVHALRYFKTAFVDQFDEIIAVAAKDLPEQVAIKEDFERFYRFYYKNFFTHINFTSEEIHHYDSFFSDELEEIATSDALNFIEKYQISSSDVIFFPHLDFYGIVGLLNALLVQPDADRPLLMLRFIGVMENATRQYNVPINELLLRIAVAAKRGLRFRYSAETPRYADRLATFLNEPVAVTGYPLEIQCLPLEPEGPFTFYCPGSARGDKGFYALRDIFQSVRLRDPFCHLRFITQNLNPHELKHQLSYSAQIYATPGVELQGGSVGVDEMLRSYARSHAALLPYDVGVYEYRGSAVLMEAAAYGRPVITYDRSGFSDVVKYFNLGIVVQSQSEMIEALFHLAMRPRRQIESEARQAAFRFYSDNKKSYQTWMEGL